MSAQNLAFALLTAAMLSYSPTLPRVGPLALAVFPR